MIEVAALGELLIDFIPTGESTADEPVLKAMVGGAPGNFAAAAQTYGVHSALIGKVGADAFGNLLVSRFSRLGVETRGLIQDGGVFTTLAFVTLSDCGDRSFSFARKPGADTQLTAEECDVGLIDEARLFHFGTLSLTQEPVRSATVQMLAHARAKGKLISFDPNLRLSLWSSPEAAKEQMLWGLGQADLVKISEDEVEFLFSCGEQEGAARILRQYGARLVLVTLGARGCYFATERFEGFTAAPSVHPIDTTGAGDIFFGAAVSRLLRINKEVDKWEKDEVRSAAAFGCAAASLSTQRHGGIASIPSESEVMALLHTQEADL